MKYVLTAVAVVTCLVPRGHAQSKSLLIEDMTWTEVRDAIAAGKTTAVYYAGSIEQKGQGLALGKHLFLAHYIAQRIAEELGNALVYPAVKDDGRGSTGVNGDQTIGTAELGKMFVGYKIKDAADQIRTLVK